MKFDVIVIPEPDDNGFSEEPYVKMCDDYHEMNDAIGCDYSDRVYVEQLSESRFLNLFVDDEGKLKNRPVNNTVMIWIKSLGFDLAQTFDGTVVLCVIDDDGESVHFTLNELEAIMEQLNKAHCEGQGKVLEPSEPFMFVTGF